MVNVSELPSCQFISFSTWNVEMSHVVTVSQLKSYKSILGFLTCFLKVTLLGAIENGYRSVKAACSTKYGDEARENNDFSISKQFLLADFSSKIKNNKLKLFFTSTCWYVSVCLFKNQLPEHFCQQIKLTSVMTRGK